MTCDIDAVEKEKIGTALERIVESPPFMRVEPMMIGCTVYFERDASGRAARLPMNIEDKFYVTMMTGHNCK